MSEEPAATPPERASRYNRSFGGLVGAMIVTVLFVVAFVGFRGIFRDQPDLEPDVDYQSCVAYLEQAGVTVVHPQSLPQGWHANGIHFERGTPPQWQLGMVTPDGTFVGLVQQQKDVKELLPTYVDKAPIPGPDATPTNDLDVATWQTWSDSGGDHAYSVQLSAGPLAGQTLLVYGSASAADQQTFLGSLTVDPVGQEVRAADCDTDDLQ